MLRRLLSTQWASMRRSELIEVRWLCIFGRLSGDTEEVGVLDDEMDACCRRRRLLDVKGLLNEQQRVKRKLLGVTRIAQQ